MLEFDAARHEYRIDSRRLPSVTAILGVITDFSSVPADVLARAAEFGRHVHAAIHLHNMDELDLALLDPALRPYLDSWIGYLDQSGAAVIVCEQPVCDSKLGYAGTPDAVLLIRDQFVIADLKSTAAVPRTVGPQTAAYQHAYNLGEPVRSRIRKRACIHLRPDGSPARYIAQTNAADWSVFLSCLNVWRFNNDA